MSSELLSLVYFTKLLVSCNDINDCIKGPRINQSKTIVICMCFSFDAF